MQIVAWPGVCVLEVPNRWSWEASDRVISIFRPDGTGVLQVEIFPSTTSRSLIDGELASLPTAEDGDEALVDVPVGLMAGQRSTRDALGRRWVIWAAQGRDHSVKFVWFTSEAPGERENVDKILASFRWESR